MALYRPIVTHILDLDQLLADLVCILHLGTLKVDERICAWFMYFYPSSPGYQRPRNRQQAELTLNKPDTWE
jgi:hypothetical protein